VGIILEEKLAMGIELLRIFTHLKHELIIETLDKHNIPYSYHSASTAKGDVIEIKIILSRREREAVLEILRSVSPELNYTIEDIRQSTLHKPKPIYKRVFP